MSERVERPVDVELLSAYLDGQVTEAERVYVRAQLAANPAWQRELDTLLWTVNLLQATPDMPLPRSFELPVAVETPAAVSSTGRASTRQGVVAPTPWWRDMGWLYGFLRLSSAASVALLVIVFGVEMLTQSQLAFSNSSQAQNAPRAAQAPQAAAPAQSQALQQQAESAPKAAAPIEQPKAAAPTIAAAPKAEAPQAAAPPAPKATEAPKAAAPAQAPAQAPALQNPQVAPTLFPQGAEVGRAQSGGGGGQGAGGGEAGGAGQSGGAGGTTTDKGAPIVQPPATAAPQGQSQLETQPLAQRKAQEPTAPAISQAMGPAASDSAASNAAPQGLPYADETPTNPLRTLQIALGILAIGLGVGAWVVRRRLDSHQV